MPAPFTKTVRGVAVPTIGLGVFEIEPAETEAAVADALAAGYRHVDAASMYGNEEEVGRGLRSSGVDRDEVWVTTKVWMEELAPQDLRESAEGLVRDLIEEEVLHEIAEAHGATPGQVALSWLAHQDRVALLPRSTDPDRRRENLAALELDLSDEETGRIDELSERRHRNVDPGFAPDWGD